MLFINIVFKNARMMKNEILYRNLKKQHLTPNSRFQTGMIPSTLPNCSQIAGQTVLFNFGMATGQGERKL